MRKKLSRSIVAAAILTTCLTTPFAVSAQDYIGGSRPNGGAIDNTSGGTVNIDAGSNFVNNTSTAQNYGGGAIYNVGGTINIGDGTSFSNNYLNQPDTTATGGDYRSAGGAIASWGSGQVNIGKDVIFSGNGTNSITGAAAWASGGALYVDTNGSTLAGLSIGEGTQFTGNSAGSLGGAMYVADSSSAIKSAIFSNNKAGSWGGAIFNAQYYGLTGNELEITGNTSFLSNEAGSYGGAIASQYTTLKIGDTTSQITFDGNKAGKDGGAIHISTDPDPAYVATSEITNAEFTNNTATTGSGGAIYNPADMTITNSKFGNVLKDSTGNIIGAEKGNTAGLYGGAIYNELATVTFNGTNEFGGNSAVNGGALMNQSGQVNLAVNSLFAYNSASSQGGALSNLDGNITIQDGAVFDSNTAANAGAISNVSTAGHKSNLTIGDNVEFKNNTVTDYAGAILNQNSNLTIGDNAKFTNNSNGQGGGEHSGGAIAIDTNSGNTTPSFVKIGDGAQFVGNTASKSAGALYVYESSGEVSVEIGDNALFQNNTASRNGGAVAVYGATGTSAAGNKGITIGEGAVFENNTASNGNGGAIYAADFGGHSADITISGNTEFKNNSASGSGGAIYNAASNLVLDTNAGDIKFSNNTANGNANDIVAAASSNTNITGSNNVSIGSGLITEAGSSLSIKDTANLVIEQEVTADISGSITSESGAYLVNNGETTINGANSANIRNNSNLTITGDGSSNITNNSVTVLKGNHTGAFSQKDKDSSVTIDSGATFNSSSAVIEGGSLNIASGGVLVGDISVTDAVNINIEGGSSVIDATGLKVGNTGHIVMSGGSALNLSGNYTVDGGVLGTSVIISNGSINANPAGPLTINNSKVLTLSDNATSDGAYIVEADGTLKLAPTAGNSLTLATANIVNGSGEVLVDEIVTTVQKYNPQTSSYDTETIHKGVGTVNINSDNSAFSGNYLQKMGNVIAQAGSKFFGGSNTVQGGSLTLQQGADITTEINAVANGSGGYGTINIYNPVEGVIGEDGINRISADTIGKDSGSSTLIYINSDDSTQNINITSAGLGLFEGTRLEGDLTLNENGGVRDLTFGNGSGAESNTITLGSNTKLTYKDNAFIKDDSSVSVGSNASLNFANETTNVDYRPVISSVDDSALITKTGAGETVIAATLRDYHGSISASDGVLDLANTDDLTLNNISVNNATLHIAPNTSATGSVSANNSVFNADGDLLVNGNLNVNNSQVNVNGRTQAADATFAGANSVINLKGAGYFDNLNLSGATLNANSNINVNGTMSFTNNPTIGLASGSINTINANIVDMTNSGANIAFDLDPRSQAIDSIVANSILNNPTSPNKILITGINMTRSPIDRNVGIDISNLLRDSSGSQSDMVALPDGGVIARTAMGDYSITATSASNMFNAALLDVNPQMYRGQVATLASWQNQLVVNNLMFDHMQVITRQLMDDAKTANKYSAILPQFAPYQYSAKEGSLWYKAYGNFERLSMTRGLSIGNNTYGSLIGADFPLVDLKNGWKLVPTAYIGYNGGHQTYDGVSLYQNGAQLGLMGTAYKGDFLTSLLVYGGGYGNDMSVRGSYGNGGDTTGNWFAGVASKTAYNIHLPHDLIFQPTAMVAYNAIGNQNWGSSFGAMSMNAGMLNGINAAPGFNLIWNKKTFSIYATAQMVYNIMGGVDGKAGNIDLGYARMRHSYFEYGFGVMKRFKDTFNGYLQMTFRNGGRTGVGFQGGLQWKPGRDKK